MPNQDITGNFAGQLNGRKTIFIASPAYKSLYASAYVESFFALTKEAQKRGIGLEFAHVDTADIVLSRNYLVSRFYFECPTASHLLFLDSDMGFPPSLIMKMLDLDSNVAGVIYPKRTINLEKLHSKAGVPFRKAYAESCEFVGLLEVWTKKFEIELVGGDKETKVVQNNVRKQKAPFIKVKRVGTGVLLIKREAITKMIANCPEISKLNKPRGSKGGMFDRLSNYITPFNKVVVDGHELSEDYSFCHRWTEQCGGTIMASTSSPIKHVGELTIETKFSDTWDAE